MSSQQFAILSRHPANNNGMAPIGNRLQIIRELSHHNTAPDHEGDDVLYGPGITLQLPPGQDTVQQMLMTVTEEEIAWLVIMRLAKTFNWKIVDTETGRELNA